MARTTAVPLLAVVTALALVTSTRGQDLLGGGLTQALTTAIGNSPVAASLINSNFGQAAAQNTSAVIAVATSPLAEEINDNRGDVSRVNVNPDVEALLNAPAPEQPELVNDVVIVAKTATVTGNAAQDLADAQNALAVAAGVPTLSPSEALKNRKLLQA